MSEPSLEHVEHERCLEFLSRAPLESSGSYGKGIASRTLAMEQYAEDAARRKIERAIVETVVRRIYDTVISDLIRNWNPPGPDGAYIIPGRLIFVWVVMRGYDQIRND